MYNRHAHNVNSHFQTQQQSTAMNAKTLLSLPEIQRRLEDRNLSEVARRVGMTRQQVWAIASGINTNPSYETIKRISDYLTGGV